MSVLYKRQESDRLFELKISDNSLHSTLPHSHNESSLGFIEKGCCRIEVRGYSKTLEAPSLVYFAPGIVHSSIADTTAEWRFRVIYWNAHNKYSHCHVAQTTLDPISALKVEQLYTHWEKVPVDPVILEALLDSFISPQNNDAAIESPIWNEMEILLKHDYEGFWSLDRLAAKMGYDKRYLTRVFKRRFGTTPAFYRQICRVTHAKDLLRQGYAISDVAQICGFHDQSHLTKVFVAFSGTTPKHYREA